MQLESRTQPVDASTGSASMIQPLAAVRGLSETGEGMAAEGRPVFELHPIDREPGESHMGATVS